VNIELPPVVAQLIERGAAVMVSVSGGKDSQSMEKHLSRLRRVQRWPGPFLAAHADIGQGDAELDWPWTIPVCERNAQALGHDFHIVRHPGLTLCGLVERRVETTLGHGTPPFPSMACRYCTSDCKRAPLDKLARRFGLVVIAVGLRAEESPGRKKQPVLTVHRGITTQKLLKEHLRLTPEEALSRWQPDMGRLALLWNPILDWTADDVWAEIGVSQTELDARRDMLALGMNAKAFSGWLASPTYVLGQSRHSCAACIFSSKADMEIAVRYRRAVIERLAAMETRSGFAWQQGKSLSALLAAVPAQPIPAEAFVLPPLPHTYFS